MVLWSGFITLILGFLALDLGVFNKESHTISTREALSWTSLWVTISLLFSGAIYLIYQSEWVANPEQLLPMEAVLTYLTGYVIELSLSLDNIFVIALIFAYFKIPREYQHRVLFWGILGAIVFRAIMIVAGVVLIRSFSWTIYFFGALLLYSAYKMLSTDDESIDPNKNRVITLFKRFFPVTKNLEGEQFFVNLKGVMAATPLFITLVMVETTDVLFAVDSIPAILAITSDPFLVFSSNIFAILGLRSLYFVLAAMLDKFQYLKYSLVFVLAFVGIKMLLTHVVHIPGWLSLVVILGALIVGVAFSLYKAKKMEASSTTPLE